MQNIWVYNHQWLIYSPPNLIFRTFAVEFIYISNILMTRVVIFKWYDLKIFLSPDFLVYFYKCVWTFFFHYFSKQLIVCLLCFPINVAQNRVNTSKGNCNPFVYPICIWLIPLSYISTTNKKVRDDWSNLSSLLFMILCTCFHKYYTCIYLYPVTTVHEQYAFLPSDLPNYAFRAGRLAFHGGKTRLWPVGLPIKSGILYMYLYFLLDF